MITRPLAPAETFYRMHTPRWAMAPMSGAGAANVGGRFNRPGVPALYLSSETATAIAEYQQDELLMPPGTLVTYRVALTEIVSFKAGYVAGSWEPIWEDWDCEFRKLSIVENVEPPSWLLGDLVLAKGIKGIMFPSTKVPTGTNLVIYTDLLGASDELIVHDPNGRLPQNQSSWQP